MTGLELARRAITLDRYNYHYNHWDRTGVLSMLFKSSV